MDEKNDNNWIKKVVLSIVFLAGLISVIKKLIELRDTSRDSSDGDEAKVNGTRSVRIVSKKRPSRVSNKLSQAFKLGERQNKIYDFVQSRKQTTMQVIAKEVPGVSARTLRRDMNKLVELGLIKRVGKTKDSIYMMRE